MNGIFTPETLQLTISLVSLIIIIWLFLGYSKVYQSKEPKRDVIYISGYFVLIIIELIVYACMNNTRHDDIIATVGFGATLSSLILSVIAIFYTLNSGREGKEQLGRISQATEELKRTAEGMQTFKAVADSLSEDIKKIDQHLEGHMNELKNETREIHESINSASFLGQENSQATKGAINDKIDIEEFVNRGSAFGATLLLSCALSKKTGKEFFEYKDRTSENWYGYGYIIACSAYKIVTFEGEWPQIKITAVTEGLEKACRERIEKNIENLPDGEGKDNIKKNYDELIEYYEKSES